MPPISETGHTINIDNFKKIIEHCEAFGTDYQPSNQDIIIVNLTAKWTEGVDTQKEYQDAIGETKLPVDDREVLYDHMEKMAVRAKESYGSTKASNQAKEDAAGYVRRITGSNVKVKRLENNIPDPKHVSNSQQGFIHRAEHFEDLVILLKNDTKYAPNEDFLKIVYLEGIISDINDANKLVEEKIAGVDKKRALRNHVIYDVGLGMVDLSLAVKKYVRGLYGPTSDEAKSVRSIPVRRIMKTYPQPV